MVNGERVWQWIAALPAFVAMSALAATHDGVVDDTFITFRYAQNWVETGRLTWHVALPPVDGYTSLGHVVLLALGHWAGFDLVTFNSYLNLACAAGIAVTFVAMCRSARVGGWSAVIGLYLIAVNSSLAFWVTAGLDAVLWALSFSLAYLTLERSLAARSFRIEFALACMGLVVVRPEGSFIAIGLLIYVGLFWWHEHLPLTRDLLTKAVAIVAAIIALHVWRFTTYGHLFPTTFYAKTSASRLTEIETGLSYLLFWFTYYGGVLALSVLLNIRRGFFENTAAYFVVGYAALVVFAGGDPQQQVRFFIPLVPLVVLQLVRAFEHQAVGFRLTATLMAVLYAFAQFGGKEPYHGVWPLNQSATLADLTSPLAVSDRMARGLRRIRRREWPLTSSNYEHWNAAAAKRLGTLLRPDVEVAASDVGALAFYSRLPILDAQGLNDNELAHLPKPPGISNTWGINRLDLLVSRGVAVVIPGYFHYSSIDMSSRRVGKLNPSDWIEVATRELGDLALPLEEMARSYACVSVPRGNGNHEYLNFFVRRDRLEGVWRERTPDIRTSECW